MALAGINQSGRRKPSALENAANVASLAGTAISAAGKIDSLSNPKKGLSAEDVLSIFARTVDSEKKGSGLIQPVRKGK